MRIKTKILLFPGIAFLKTTLSINIIYRWEISSFLLMIVDGSMKRNTYKPPGIWDTSRFTGAALELTHKTVCPIELTTDIIPFPKLPFTVTILLAGLGDRLIVTCAGMLIDIILL
jgi:hypothetical protein